MQFNLDEDQQQLADSVTRYLRDHHGFADRGAFMGEGGAPAAALRALWLRFGEMGWLGAAAPAEHGGAGLGLAAAAPVLEALGAHLVLAPFANAALAVPQLLLQAAAPEQLEAWLPPLLAGERLAVIAHEESGMRYQWTDPATTVRRGPAGLVLDGAKQAVPCGAMADAWIVPARTDAGALTLLYVPATAAGVRVDAYRSVDGVPTADLEFTGVSLAAGACIGEWGEGAAPLEHAMGVLLAATCMEAVGTMARLHALTLEYAKVRTQFGTAIGSFQVIQHKLVDMFTQIELSRPLAMLAMSSAAQGGQDAQGLQPDAPPLPALLSAAKAQASAACRLVGEYAVQIHGGIGMTDECEASHLFKRLVALEKRIGDRAHHLGVLAAGISAGRPTLYA